MAAFVETLVPTRCNHEATDAGMRNPITGISGCCARAASGPHGASGHFHLSQRCLGHGSSWIDEHSHLYRSRHQLAQQFQPLRPHFNRQEIDASQVAAGPGEAGDKTRPDRVFGDTRGFGPLEDTTGVHTDLTIGIRMLPPS